MNFEITISTSSKRSSGNIMLHLLALFAFGITGVVALIVYYYTRSPRSLGLGAALIGLTIVLLAILIFKNSWLRKQQTNNFLGIAEAAISITLCAIFVVKQWKVPGTLFALLSATIIFGFFYARIRQNILLANFDENGIELPSFTRKKFLQWQEVNHVLLRHGVLTIDCSNNFLYQWNVDADNIDSSAFERFCTEQIKKSENKKTADW